MISSLNAHADLIIQRVNVKLSQPKFNTCAVYSVINVPTYSAASETNKERSFYKSQLGYAQLERKNAVTKTIRGPPRVISVMSLRKKFQLIFSEYKFHIVRCHVTNVFSRITKKKAAPSSHALRSKFMVTSNKKTSRCGTAA